MKSIRQWLWILIVFLTVPATGFAQTPSAPKLINLQAVVVDEGGNVIYNTQEDEVTFQIVDVTGTVHYEEVQHVVFVKGAMSVLVGSGNNPSTGQATGGIPAEALTPDGSRLLRYKLNSQTIPQEDLELVSVPYSYYAQYALDVANPIDSKSILDATIQTADLSQELLDYLSNTVTQTTEQDLQSHRTERGAHEANAIIVSNSFVHAAGSDLQTVLEGLDNAIGLLYDSASSIETASDNLAQRLDQEIIDRQNGDAALGATVAGHTSILGNHEIRIEALEANDIPDDPSYNSVTVTGNAPATPAVQRLYQSNLSVAWAKVDANNGSTPSLAGGFNIRAFAASCDAACNNSCRDPDGSGTSYDGSYYKLCFATKPSNAADNIVVDSYAVTGNVYSNGPTSNDNIVMITQTYSNYFVVRIMDAGDQANSDPLSDFMISVIGWDR